MARLAPLRDPLMPRVLAITIIRPPTHELQVLERSAVSDIAVGSIGRRRVPPVLRFSTSVSAVMRRERPRPRTANSAQGHLAESLTPHLPISQVCWGT
jgi:hypothetical protein